MNQPKPIQTYESAAKELEEICNTLQNGEIEIDLIKQTSQRAVTLIAFCRNYLNDIDQEVSQILNLKKSE